jgi:hypothetical protein
MLGPGASGSDELRPTLLQYQSDDEDQNQSHYYSALGSLEMARGFLIGK